MPPGNGQDLIHVRGTTQDMNGQNGAGVFRDAVFDVCGVHLKSLQIGIYKHRQRIAQYNGVNGGDVSKRRDQDLVPRTDPQKLHGHMETVRPARGHHAPLRAYFIRPGFFKLRDEFPIERARAMIAQRLQNVLLI
jgi:hypothetical protein